MVEHMDKKFSLYSELLMDHYRSPRFSGTLENPDFSIELKNESCGDALCLTGIIRDHKLVTARYVGVGCILSQAFASLLLQEAHDKPLSALQALTVRTFVDGRA